MLEVGKLKEKKSIEKVLPEDVSPIRYMINEAFSLNTKFIKDFEEARATRDAVVIMEGDWGGQIYVVCTMEQIKCDEDTLKQLLKDLDGIAWECNEGEGQGIYYEVRKVGEGIGGGMGGARVESGMWIHDEFKEKHLENEIKKVIFGEQIRIRKSIGGPIDEK